MSPSTRQKTMNKLIANYLGWGRRIRTSPAGSRVRCPTARRSPKGGELSSEDRIFQQLIQSQLPNPHRLACCLDPLCNLSIAYPAVLKYAPVLKYQPKELLPGDGPPCHFVIKDTDNAHETVPPLAPPTLRALTPLSADETEVMMAPSTLPESVTEVAAC